MPAGPTLLPSRLRALVQLEIKINVITDFSTMKDRALSAPQ